MTTDGAIKYFEHMKNGSPAIIALTAARRWMRSENDETRRR